MATTSPIYAMPSASFPQNQLHVPSLGALKVKRLKLDNLILGLIFVVAQHLLRETWSHSWRRSVCPGGAGIRLRLEVNGWRWRWRAWVRASGPLGHSKTLDPIDHRIPSPRCGNAILFTSCFSQSLALVAFFAQRNRNADQNWFYFVTDCPIFCVYTFLYRCKMILIQCFKFW